MANMRTVSTQSKRPEHELQWAGHVERVLHAQTRRGSECVRRLVPALTAADCWTSCDFVVVSPSTCSHLQTCDRRRWRHRLLQQQQQLRNWIIKHSRFTGEARRHSELQTWVIVIMWHNKTIVLEVKLWTARSTDIDPDIYNEARNNDRRTGSDQLKARMRLPISD